VRDDFGCYAKVSACVIAIGGRAGAV